MLLDSAKKFDGLELTRGGCLDRKRCRKEIKSLVDAFIPDPDMTTEMFMRKYDLNNDGKVSKEEYLTVEVQVYDEIILSTVDI